MTMLSALKLGARQFASLGKTFCLLLPPYAHFFHTNKPYRVQKKARPRQLLPNK